MAEVNHKHLAEGLLSAVLAAGQLQMRYFASDLVVEAKSDASPVTIADQESEALIIAALGHLAPGIPVLAEEQSAAGIVPTAGDTFFAVDPLDGTKGYLAKRPDFTINIGLIDRGVPRFGMIYAPARGSLYVTWDDGAVSCDLPPNSLATSLTACTLQKLQPRQPQPGALLALTSHSTRGKGDAATLASWGVAASQPLDSSIKFCLIAAGLADVYGRFGPTNEWDTAAGQAILTAAGGSVTTFDGQPLRYGKTETRYLNPEFVAWGRAPERAATL